MAKSDAKRRRAARNKAARRAAEVRKARAARPATTARDRGDRVDDEDPVLPRSEASVGPDAVTTGWAVPGAGMVLAAFVLALLASGVIAFAPLAESTETGRSEPGGPTVTTTDSTSLLESEGASVLVVVAIPVTLAGAAVMATPTRRRRRVWTVAAALLGAWVVIGLASIGLFYLPAAAALGLAAWRLRRADRRRG